MASYFCGPSTLMDSFLGPTAPNSGDCGASGLFFAPLRLADTFLFEIIRRLGLLLLLGG